MSVTPPTDLIAQLVPALKEAIADPWQPFLEQVADLLAQLKEVIITLSGHEADATDIQADTMSVSKITESIQEALGAGQPAHVVSERTRSGHQADIVSVTQHPSGHRTPSETPLPAADDAFDPFEADYHESRARFAEEADIAGSLSGHQADTVSVSNILEDTREIPSDHSDDVAVSERTSSGHEADIFDWKSTFSPDAAWQETLGEIELQMTKAAFNRWFKGAHLIQAEKLPFTIGVSTENAREWLENRLGNTINRTFSSVCGQMVTCEYVVCDTPAYIARAGAVHKDHDPFISSNTDTKNILVEEKRDHDLNACYCEDTCTCAIDKASDFLRELINEAIKVRVSLGASKLRTEAHVTELRDNGNTLVIPLVDADMMQTATMYKAIFDKILKDWGETEVKLAFEYKICTPNRDAFIEVLRFQKFSPAQIAKIMSIEGIMGLGVGWVEAMAEKIQLDVKNPKQSINSASPQKLYFRMRDAKQIVKFPPHGWDKHYIAHVLGI